MQSCQIPWKIMRYIYVTLICIRKFQDNSQLYWIEKLLPVGSAFLPLYLFDRDQWRSLAALLFCQVKCWYWKYWNSQQDIWLLWSILLQLLNRHSWAGCGLKIRMLIPRFFRGKAHPGSNGELGPLRSSVWKHMRSLQGQALSEVFFCGEVFLLCCVFWQIATKTWAWMLLSAEK